MIRLRDLIPVSFRGFGLETLGRSVFFERETGAFDTPEHSPVAFARSGRYPSFVRGQPQGKTLPLRCVVSSRDKEGQFNALARIFDPADGEGLLVVRDCDGLRKRLTCAPQRIIHEQESGSDLTIPLFAAYPLLENDEQSVETDTISGAPWNVTFDCLNAGTADALPILQAEAQVLKSDLAGYRKMMEIAYANRSEDSLTGPGSGTWLLCLPDSTGWDTTAEVAAARMFADGRDIAVFLDGRKVPDEKVTIDGPNTTTTKVWVEIADGPAISADLLTAIVAGTTTFTMGIENHGFQVDDYLTWVNDAAATEQAKVTAVDGADVTVERNVRGFATAGNSAAGTTIYRSGHHVQLAWDFSGALVRPTNPDPPLINTDTSTNLKWDWNTFAMWADQNRRPGGWRRILYEGREDIPELRRNRLSAKTTLGVITAGPFANSIVFSDIEPTALDPNFDAIEFRACCGVDDSLGAIEYDAIVSWPFCLQVIGRDLLGLDAVIFNRLGHESGNSHLTASVYTNRQETPPAVLRSVILRARNMIVCTARPADTALELLATALATGHDLQTFTLVAETQLVGIVIRAKETSGTPGMSVQLHEVDESSSSPPVGERLVGPFTIAGGGIGASLVVVCFFPTFGANTTDIPKLEAGDYMLSMVRSAAGTLEVPVSGNSIYARGSHYEFDGAAWVRFPDEDLWFAILSLTTDNQEETLDIARTGEVLIMNDITIVFDPARTPIVTRGAEEDAYHYRTTWSLGGVDVSIDYLKRWADAQNNTITIDVKERTVTDDENGDNIRSSLTIEQDPSFPLPAARNQVVVSAPPGTNGEAVSVTWRDTWQ